MKRKVLVLTVLVIMTLNIILTGCAGTETATSSVPGGSSAATSSAPGGSSAATSSAPSGSSAVAVTGDTVKIGFLGNLAGEEAYIGQAAKMALEDYLKDLNDKGGLLGKKLELVVYDYSIDPPAEAVSATQRFCQQDKVIAIIGPSGSQPAIPMAPIVNEAHVPVIATSATNPKVTVDDNGKVHPYMFRVCFIDPYQGTVLASFAYNDLKLKKIATVAQIGDPYAEQLAAYFKEKFTALGGEVVKEFGYQKKDVEFRAILTEAGKNNAEALFVPATVYRDAGLMAKQAKDLGLKFTFLFGDGIYSKELLEIAGSELEGAYMTNGISEDDPQFDAYKKEFAAKHPGQSANIYVFYALDAMKLLEAAILKVGSYDTAKIRDALEASTDIPCFTDKLTIEKDTHNPHNKTVSILKITGSKYSLYKTYKPQD